VAKILSAKLIQNAKSAIASAFAPSFAAALA
jgi:hypothetical protein